MTSNIIENNQQHVRIDAFDIARGGAVIFMVVIHVQMVFSTKEVSRSLLGIIIEFLGGPLAAPVFMVVMGASFPFSKKVSTVDGIKRGIIVFLSGYLLNAVRGVFPALIYRLLLSKSGVENGLVDEGVSYSSFFLLVDILQFAGIAIVFLTLLRRFEVKPLVIIIISLGISLISPVLWEIKVPVPVLGHLADLLWGHDVQRGIIENRICFPAFPWLVFPFIGLVIGKYLKEAKNIDRSMGIIAFAGVLLLIPGIILLVMDFEYHFNDYYHARFGSICAMIGIVFIWLCICHFFSKIDFFRPIRGFLVSCSRNVTPIYSIQWILIAWLVFLVSVNSLGIPASLLFSLLILVLSCLLSLLYRKIRKKMLSL